MSSFNFVQIKFVHYLHSFKFALSDAVAFFSKYSLKSNT